VIEFEFSNVEVRKYTETDSNNYSQNNSFSNSCC